MFSSPLQLAARAVAGAVLDPSGSRSRGIVGRRYAGNGSSSNRLRLSPPGASPSRPWSARSAGTPRSPPGRPPGTRSVSSCAWYFFERVTILPYSGCFTRRSTSTVTVFFILSLTTRPVSVRWFLAGGRLFRRSFAHFAAFSFRTVRTRAMSRRTFFDLAGVGELLRRDLHAQAELRLEQLVQLLLQLVAALGPQFTRFHGLSDPACAARTMVRIGSFAAASANASLRQRLVHAVHLVEHLAGLDLGTRSTPDCPCRCPCGLRPASARSACPGRCGSRCGRRA